MYIQSGVVKDEWLGNGRASRMYTVAGSSPQRFVLCCPGKLLEDTVFPVICQALLEALLLPPHTHCCLQCLLSQWLTEPTVTVTYSAYCHSDLQCSIYCHSDLVPTATVVYSVYCYCLLCVQSENMDGRVHDNIYRHVLYIHTVKQHWG